MSQTIKQRVEQLLSEGMRLDYIWLYIQEEFPHRCAGWNYMQAIQRAYLARDLQ